MPSTDIQWQKSYYEELLRKDESVSIHQSNIQIIATEMYKVKSGYTP